MFYIIVFFEFCLYIDKNLLFEEKFNFNMNKNYTSKANEAYILLWEFNNNLKLFKSEFFYSKHWAQPIIF